MSVQAIAWVLEDAPDVKPHLVAVLMGIANHADQNGRGSYPSQELLAHYSRKGDRAVREDLDALEGCGLIRRGDQRIVLHLPPDKRPVVWDLAMATNDPRRAPRPERRAPGRPRKTQVSSGRENGGVQGPGRFSKNGGVHRPARVPSANREGLQIQIGGVHRPDEPSLEPSENQPPPPFPPVEIAAVPGAQDPEGEDSSASPGYNPEALAARALALAGHWSKTKLDAVLRHPDILARAELNGPAVEEVVLALAGGEEYGITHSPYGILREGPWWGDKMPPKPKERRLAKPPCSKGHTGQAEGSCSACNGEAKGADAPRQDGHGQDEGPTGPAVCWRCQTKCVPDAAGHRRCPKCPTGVPAPRANRRPADQPILQEATI